MRCSRCGHDNPAGYRFCGDCGLPPSATGPAPAPLLTDHHDEATRYLCAAVHFESALARIVVQNVMEEPLCAVAQSPQVDLEAVCRHAVAARWRQAIRDGILAVLLLGFIVYSLLPDDSSSSPLDGASELLAIPLLLLGLFGLLPYLLVVGWCVIFTEQCLARWGSTAHTLRRDKFRRADAPRTPNDPAVEQLAHVSHYANSNLTVYQGYNPFLGHGWSVRGWSFALDITKRQRPQDPIESFAVVDLNKRLHKRVGELDVAGINVYNRLFVNGDDIHQDGRLLPDPYGRPVAWIDDTVMTALMDRPENNARPYLATEIVGWDGELVWSAFVRLVLSETSLFVEMNCCVLPPLRLSFHEIDELLLRPAPKPVLRLMGHSARILPRTLLNCVPSVIHAMFSAPLYRRKQRRQRKQIREMRSFNHGARISIREAASDLRRNKGDLSLGYHRYFQFLDEQMYTKTVEKRVIEALGEFLVEHNIDPDELLRRAEQVVNNSVTFAGDATIMNSAIGGGSATVGAPVTRGGSESH
ncbi:zinc ribbon domain-containing protein [Nocardia sp. NPDC058058]|uniref:zinc ribbon domain-containing protein n=1 Tax=Nocardia sp. NPDC058058 TaxID=3346317 RepID=UPI0036D9E382